MGLVLAYSLRMKTIFIIFITFVSSFSLFAGESMIPLLKGPMLPSDDLVYNGEVISARDALALKNVDLSLLNPQPNDVWPDQITKTIADDQQNVGLVENASATYQGSLLSNEGLFRFNVLSDDDGKIYTIHLDKTLHSLLLRKNLLRKLGYEIPETKYLKHLSVKFESQVELDKFLIRGIPDGTDGAPERWVKQGGNLEIVLQDIAVTEPSEKDYYNVAMGIPKQAMNSRTIRSLVVPYNLVDLSESVNKFNWVSGKIDNKFLVLSHFTKNQFSSSVDDVNWMLRKINKLTRADFKEIVDQSYFPADVGALVLEKIISRRNFLNKLLANTEKDLAFDPNVSSGKIKEQHYDGYASRFAYGDAESPMEQMDSFFHSIIQSNIIDNLVSTFNQKLIDTSVNDARTEYFTQQFKDGLDHFIKTGELRPIGVGAWTSPSVGIRLLFSRDIVIGNYLGANNLVQMADTIGGSMDLGLHIGIEGLGNNLASSLQVGASIVRTFSHLKPVKTLKASMKEPYRNMFVSHLKNSLAKKYFTLSELKNLNTSDTEKNKSAQELLKLIEKELDVGESLIMTDRTMPSVDVKLNMTQGIFSAVAGVNSSISTIKRIHFYKKSATIIQIFDDSGEVKSLDLSFQMRNYIPILKISSKYDKGNYGVKSYLVNTSSDLTENPNLFTNALGLYQVLNKRSFEVLNTVTTPVKLKASYVDRSMRFSLLLWKMKSLSGKSYYDVEAKDGVHGSYFSYTKDFMSGMNFESFSKQLANYYLVDRVRNFSISSIDDKNPGETLFGHSSTQTINFEAEVDENKEFSRKFISLSDIKQGWSSSKKGLLKFIGDTNKKFQTELFNDQQIDFEKIRLYRIGYHLNIYERGIARLAAITAGDIEKLAESYNRSCLADFPIYGTAFCGDFHDLRYKIMECSRPNSEENKNVCLTDLAQQMFNEIKFQDLKMLMGENNLYVYATIDGFREKSEVLNDTIYSNSIGKIGSDKWQGPLQVVRDLVGMPEGEFSGGWLREGGR
jgi:hypothetical protein